jgi:hypothetical protein
MITAYLAANTKSIFIAEAFILNLMKNCEKKLMGRVDTLCGQLEAYHAFLESLKKAVSAGAKKTAASMVDHPTTVSIGYKDIKIKSGKAWSPTMIMCLKRK